LGKTVLLRREYWVRKNRYCNWVNNLFPLNTDGKLAPKAQFKRDVKSFPSVTGSVPFKWHYLGTISSCEFEGGLTHTGWDTTAKHVYCKPTWKITRKLTKSVPHSILKIKLQGVIEEEEE
jgi:hypothetical protein